MAVDISMMLLKTEYALDAVLRNQERHVPHLLTSATITPATSLPHTWFRRYRGVVDDPRNTDCAWMETTAVLHHDDDGSVTRQFKLQGDIVNACRYWFVIYSY